MTVTIFTFCVGDLAVTVPVVPDEVTGLRTVEDGLAVSNCLVDLILILPNTTL